MGNKKTFVNPLTRSSEEDLHIPTTVAPTPTSNFPTTNEYPSLRKRGNKAFEKTHERFTGWMDKQLKKQLEKLAQEQGVSKTSLLNEAIADLLRKHMRK
jgi:Ribbon-helix-helix domain